MAGRHHAHQYNNREQYLASLDQSKPSLRRGKLYWKRHIEKNGNVAMIIQCGVCSGLERKLDIKFGNFTPARPSKRLRVETEEDMRSLGELTNEEFMKELLKDD